MVNKLLETVSIIHEKGAKRRLFSLLPEFRLVISLLASLLASLVASLVTSLVVPSLVIPSLAAADISRLNCPAPAYDETATVRKVHDGDTLWLEDGRKIRLIGINAPELARDDKTADDAFALEARDHLKQRLLDNNNRVGLVFGEQRADRYQRTLAHVFLQDGLNLQADLIGQGLATASTFPPNVVFSDCYHLMEHNARCDKKGLWSKALAGIQQSTELDNHANGFHRLRGKIEAISESNKGVWLNMQGGILLGIRHDELDYFSKTWLSSLKGRTVLVRGWLNPAGNKKKGVTFYIRIRHPSSIQLLEGTDYMQKC